MNPIRFFAELTTPVGPITVVTDGSRITRISLRSAAAILTAEPGFDWRPAPAADSLTEQTRAQINAYFDGDLHSFTLPLAPEGTPFQQQVWAALQRIPFGQTTSYGALAAQLGRPGSARAVGAANRQNPIAIVVPCHRVIGSNGTLTGYAGGIERKGLLLDHEARASGVRLAL
jgi:methylated-DNA-[protein]-cysteine S-methyltransferase